MAKIIKNTDSVSKTWGGMLIASGQSYTCQSQTEANRFSNDDNFIADLNSNKAEVYNDATKVIGQASSINFLNGALYDSSGYPLVRSAAFPDHEGFRFRGHSFAGTATAGQTTNIDYKLTAERHMNGGRLILQDNHIDDQICFQVIDKDNVLGYGANTILDEFIKDYYLPLNSNLEVRLDYKAKIIANLYLRLVYKSAGNTDVLVRCNLYLHWKAA